MPNGKNYYNEFDKNAAAWLRNLIAAGLIAPGDVDDRSIEDVTPSDLAGYTQCHFFAGIGVWSYALRRAGWRDDEPVWTGSCPCQPFSAAGKGEGFADERHLWPAWWWLQQHAKPRGVPVFGEQVASKAGLAWLDVVQADLEGQGYTVRALDLCAAGVGAPHIRQRLFFVADHDGDGRHRSSSARLHERRKTSRGGEPAQGDVDGARGHDAHGRGADVHGELADAERDSRGARRSAVESTEGSRAPGAGASTESGRRGVSRELADAGGARVRDRRSGADAQAPRGAEGTRSKRQRVRDDARHDSGGGVSAAGVMGDADDARSQGRSLSGATAGGDGASECAAGSAGSACGELADAGSEGRRQVGEIAGGSDQGSGAAWLEQRSQYRSPVNGFWADAEWLPCIDGKARPVEPGTFPLAHGAPSRVVRLRAYGNAIVAPLAEEFIRAYREVRGLALARPQSFEDLL